MSLLVVTLRIVGVLESELMFSFSLSSSKDKTKLISKVSYGNYKRNQQGVSNIFLHYLYNKYMVCASDK